MAIAIQLNGGLGNQMFQYAFGIYLSTKKKTGLRLDVSLLGHYYIKGANHNKYRLHVFGIRRGLPFPLWVYHTLCAINYSVMSRVARIFVDKSKYHQLYEKKDFIFDPSVLDAPDNSYVRGYWQSYKYLEPVEDILRERLQFIHPKSESALGYQKQIQSATHPVCIHVRRNDYLVVEKEQGLSVLIGKEYIESGIEIIRDKVGENLSLFVFSDDTQWCINNLELGYPTTFVMTDGRYSYADDMWLMTQCHHFVIAKSSYSWWGAWLSRYEGKTVVAPRKWFGAKDSDPDCTDLIPPDWIKA